MADPASKYDFGPVIDVLKSVGVVAGGLGSAAALFFWIGNAIIVARLREYNLYGVVHYTDEYVTEAGYQFFQDIFTFFQEWKLIILFLAVTASIFMTIPIGPFAPGKSEEIPTNPLLRVISRTSSWLRRHGIHYVIFILLALSASTILTTNIPVNRLYTNIYRQELLLNTLAEEMKGKLLLFTPRPLGDIDADPFQQRFYEQLSYGEKPTGEWLAGALAQFYNNERSYADKASLRNGVAKFQQEFEIHESPEFRFDGDFARSQTFQTLFNIRLNEKLNKALSLAVNDTLDNVRQHLGAHRTEFRDFSTIVDYTANYNDVNNAIAKLKSLRRNTLTFYNPTQGEAKRVMAKLADLEPIHFGQVLLSYSFWVLVGIMVYLLLNSPRILKFKSWEVGYFIVMTILFFTILVTLPAAYGRYRFEFKIQKLNDIVFTGETGGPGAIRQKLEELRRKNATLFLLGPTKGKEVILGAVGSQDPAVITPQLIMLERDTFKFMTVEPVRNEDIPQIVKLLRQNR